MSTIALATPTIRPGAIKSNVKEIITLIEKAKKADLIVFPRLCITGATCGSMYSFPALIMGARKALDEIAASVRDKCVVLGLPVFKDGAVYDATAVINGGNMLKGGEDLGANVKLFYLPQGLFDGDSLSLSFGSDEPELDIGDEKIRIVASIPPLSDEPFIVQSAYPAYLGSQQRLLNQMSKSACSAIISSGKGESVSGKIMSGDKLAVIGGKKYFAGYDEDMLLFKFGRAKGTLEPVPPRQTSLSPLSDEECDFIYELMGRGITGRMSEIGCDKVILGLSGGLDSANVLVACVLAFEKRKTDKKNIICVTMRGGASSRRTQDNAAALIEAYGVTGINVPIDVAVSQHMRAIGHDRKDTVYENAQARERTQILLDLSNKYNALMLGTGDLSEICLGWSTFGGDQLSQYNPNCSLTKTAIKKLLTRYIALKHNKAAGKILFDILNTPISPELLSGQETEAILGRYEVHDVLIEQLIAKKRSPKEALEEAERLGIPYEEAAKCMKVLTSRFFRYQFKRNFGPDGVKLFEYDLCGMTVRSDFVGEMWL